MGCRFNIGTLVFNFFLQIIINYNIIKYYFNILIYVKFNLEYYNITIILNKTNLIMINNWKLYVKTK